MTAHQAETQGNTTQDKGKVNGLTVEQRLSLIKANLQEIIDEHIIDDVIVKQGRELVLYWGTATTGKVRSHARSGKGAEKI